MVQYTPFPTVLFNNHQNNKRKGRKMKMLFKQKQNLIYFALSQSTVNLFLFYSNTVYSNLGFISILA